MPHPVIAVAAATMAIAQPFHVKLSAALPDGHRLEMLSPNGFADRSDCEQEASQARADIEREIQRASQALAQDVDGSGITAECVVKDGSSI